MNTTSWVDVNLDIVEKNIRSIKAFIGKSKLLVVVKADAYGHGIIPVTLCAIKNGADYIGVSNLDEGIFLRQNGIEKPVLIFNSILPEQAEMVLKYNLTATVCSFDLVQALNQASIKFNKNASVHIKIDTGFGRFGILPEHAMEFIKIVTSSFKNISIEGIYTHFSKASSETITRKQFNKYEHLLRKIKDENIIIPIKHVCNSVAAVKYPEMHLDMVRVGNLIYGLCTQSFLDIQKPAKIFSKITFLKNLPKGHNVGYGNRFITKKPTTIAVIPFGYYDGLGIIVSQPNGIWDALKSFIKQILMSFGIVSQNRKVIINGKYCNIIGKIGMQNCIVDVTGFNDIFVGTVVELAVRKINMNSDLPRIYHSKGETFADLRQQDIKIKDEYDYETSRKFSTG